MNIFGPSTNIFNDVCIKIKSVKDYQCLMIGLIHLFILINAV